jgi:uncharacterized protein YbjT (DUF2867 family)
MKVLLFGATGMVGRGVLRECLQDGRVTEVLAVGRTPVGEQHPKLREVVHDDLFDLGPISAQLTGIDACFFCVGVSAAGMAEADYRRLTFELTTAVARTVAQAAPGSVFVYVSGAGTADGGNSRMMWARVKGATEDALRDLPLRTWFFRPGYIQPLHGITSKTRLYAAMYRVVAPLYPVLRRTVPGQVTTTEAVGRAMIAVAADGWPRQVLTNSDINAAAA